MIKWPSKCSCTLSKTDGHLLYIKLADYISGRLQTQIKQFKDVKVRICWICWKVLTAHCMPHISISIAKQCLQSSFNVFLHERKVTSLDCNGWPMVLYKGCQTIVKQHFLLYNIGMHFSYCQKCARDILLALHRGIAEVCARWFIWYALRDVQSMRSLSNKWGRWAGVWGGP